MLLGLLSQQATGQAQERTNTETKHQNNITIEAVLSLLLKSKTGTY